jgi:hypothetical protein
MWHDVLTFTRNKVSHRANAISKHASSHMWSSPLCISSQSGRQGTEGTPRSAFPGSLQTIMCEGKLLFIGRKQLLQWLIAYQGQSLISNSQHSCWGSRRVQTLCKFHIEGDDSARLLSVRKRRSTQGAVRQAVMKHDPGSGPTGYKKWNTQGAITKHTDTGRTRSVYFALRFRRYNKLWTYKYRK